MLRSSLFALVLGVSTATVCADHALAPKPSGPFFEKFQPYEAPRQSGLLLRDGDRLAICGDSITEQKQYSRIIETYLTVCTPDLHITARQYGWSGERAGGFLGRIWDDCIRFSPTIATTCYGMNDHEYKPYEDRIGNTYREKQARIVEAFQATGARVVIGSAGCVGKMPTWVKTATGTVEDLNLSLNRLRNIDIELAEEYQARFADVFWPMFTAGFAARQNYGPEYAIEGKDGVHPAWAGHTVMAYAYLRAFGLDGDLGTIAVSLKENSASASKGHEILTAKDGEIEIKSSRYPFCTPVGDVSKDDNIRSGMTLVPFNQELNRLTLVVKDAMARRYKVTWGNETHTYNPEALAKGINLAQDFVSNPFSEAFNKVDNAVGAKQAYETKQIRQIFHELMSGKYKSADEIKDPEMKALFDLRDAEGKLDREAIVKATEERRSVLAEAVKAAFVPVTHTLKISAVD